MPIRRNADGTLTYIGKPKTYKAIMNQTGTNAPVAYVLVNTYDGAAVWTRSSAGAYLLTIAGELVQAQTARIVNNSSGNNATNIYLQEGDEGENVLLLTTQNGGAEDGRLAGTYIEITTYGEIQ